MGDSKFEYQFKDKLFLLMFTVPPQNAVPSDKF